MPAALANFNGQTMPLTEVKISALDRGFLFGDAVYEVLRVRRGKPWMEAEHFDRLARSLVAIRIGGVDIARLRQRMHETIGSGGFGDCVVYMQVTRGAVYPRRHAFPADATATELLWVEEYDDTKTAQQRQVGVGVVSQPDLRWHRCGIKSTNLLANVLANQAAAEAGAAEAILYLPDGTLTEASHSSFFWVSHGRLCTTPHDANILPGITRIEVLRLTERAGVLVNECFLKRDEVFGVDEFFLTGTTSEVLPIVRVDHRPIAGGAPGPITRRLQAAHEEAVREFLL
jgi:D-alanine transaminase